jgi:GNAT superfamily N-acetyltransferase
VDRVLLRRAVAADAATLTAIAHAAKAHWGYAPALLDLWRADLTLTAEVIAGGLVWCAVCDGDVVGFYGLSRSAATFELEHLWVEPSWMGRGHGARLLAHAIETARSAGGALLRIVSDPNAEGFYRHLGATRVGEQESLPAGRRLPVLDLVLAP